jgi:methionine aminotransferase
MIRSKLPDVGTTIFSVMSQMAHEHNALNLSQGFPDFQCSEQLVSLVHKHMKAGHNQYAPMKGVFELRQAISDKIKSLYSYTFDPKTEITVTAGATQALYTAISAFINEDDEVIILEPAYDSYVPAIKMNGGRPVFVQLKPPYYKINWSEIQKIINARTRMIILNTPHNPSGAILNAQDMEKLEKITSGTNIIVLSDEVYEHIIFDGYEHQSVARFPKLAERSMIVNSFGKTFHTTGWKMGYVAAKGKLIEEFDKVHQFLVYAINTPIQHAVSEFLQDSKNYNQVNSFYQEKRDFFNDLVKGSNFKVRPSQGTYFQLLEYSKITEEKDFDFAVRLTKEFGVAAIPVSVFYHEKLDNKVLRFCFAKENETLEKAAEKLHKL